MRPIKFRAWEESSKTMLHAVSTGTIQIWSNTTGYGAKSADCIFMQYTGLKDKDGKEIYEGDVVLWLTDVIVEIIEGHNRTEPEGQIGFIKFDEGSFYIDGADFYSHGEQMFDWDEIEVIGNIYEHGYLLIKS